MSTRWQTRLFLGYKLDDRDIDELIDTIPEILVGDIPPPEFLLFGLTYFDPDHEWMMRRLLGRTRWAIVSENWEQAVQVARRRAHRDGEGNPEERRRLPDGGRRPLECPNSECPLRAGHIKADAAPSKSQDDDGPEDEDGTVVRLITVAAPTTTPKKTFLSMANNLRKHFKGGIKRVIITDTYIHCDAGDDGSPGGHAALIEFLESLGLTTNDDFYLDLTPAPRGGTEGEPLPDTQLGLKVKAKFPRVKLEHHKATRGGFHDRFYLIIDGTGLLHGLYGPSLNGLNSFAVVLIGDLTEEHSCKGKLEKLLLHK